MKGSMRKMSQVNRTKNEAYSADAMAETLKLYHAWLAYLLTRQGDGILRVKAEDIRGALEKLACTVTKEGDEYVICLGGEEPSHGA